MNDIAQRIVSKAIVDYMNSNLQTIRENVLSGTNSEMTENEFYTQTLLNSIRVSTDLSVSIILNLLENEGLVKLRSDEKELRKLLLHLVEKDE